jgi:hypothetical protein
MIESPKVNLTEENPQILSSSKSVKNILENVEYIEPDTSLPVPNGMCVDCNIENSE